MCKVENSKTVSTGEVVVPLPVLDSRPNPSIHCQINSDNHRNANKPEDETTKPTQNECEIDTPFKVLLEHNTSRFHPALYHENIKKQAYGVIPNNLAPLCFVLTSAHLKILKCSTNLMPTLRTQIW